MSKGHPKELHNINAHLPITQFAMSFISMDILGQYRETENGSKYTLTVICMLTNYVFMIPIKLKTTEEVIKAYLKNVYSILGGNT